jgi:hypothetical protein
MKVGTYSIPDLYQLYPVVIDNIKTIYNKFETREIDLETLAPVLGHKSVNGAFNNKIAAMRAYHLLEGRGKVRVTETGRMITLPQTPDEANTALIQAVTSIPLWKIFYEKYTKVGKEIQADDFWIDLRQISGLTPEEAQTKAAAVKKAYLEDIHEIKVPKEGGTNTMNPKNQSGQGAGGEIVPPTTSPTVESISFADGAIIMTLPKENTASAWEKAKQMIDIYLGVNPKEKSKS